jgi:hypothetical protein
VPGGISGQENIVLEVMQAFLRALELLDDDFQFRVGASEQEDGAIICGADYAGEAICAFNVYPSRRTIEAVTFREWCPARKCRVIPIRVCNLISDVAARLRAAERDSGEIHYEPWIQDYRTF